VALRFLTDEDFDGRILNGLVRRLPSLDITRVQDVGLDGEPDPHILEWADSHGRILLTHDVTTMPRYASQRLRAGLGTAGICVIRQSLPIGRAIDEIVLVSECTREEEWENQVRFLPL
jgi:hypothetical protein